jgi:hypothetical protein
MPFSPAVTKSPAIMAGLFYVDYVGANSFAIGFEIATHDRE